MQKLYTLLVLLLVLASPVKAQWDFYQYFDGADTSWSNSIFVFIENDSTNIWQVDEPEKNLFDTAATIPNVIITDTLNYYPTNNTSRFTIKFINSWTSWGILALQWKQKLDFDSNFDGGIVEFTTDHGTTWQNCFNSPYVYNFYGYNATNADTLLTTGEYAFSGSDQIWKDIWLCFDLSWMSMMPDTMMFRFTMKSDSVDNNKEGWMIDNFIAHITMIHTVKEIDHESYLYTFPNPTTDIVNIDLKKIDGFHIIEQMDLLSPNGAIIDSWKNIPTKFWFKTDKYDNGSYLLRVKTNIKTETIPLIINKN